MSIASEILEQIAQGKPVRDAIKDSLGNSCSRCKFSSAPQILNIHCSSRSRGKTENYHKYIMALLGHANDITLLCPNCVAVAKLNKAETKSPSPAFSPVTVWKTNSSIESVRNLGPYSWLEDAQKQGREALVIVASGELYSYPSYSKLSSSWTEYFSDRGLPSLSLVEGVHNLEKD